jgi:hypothetical protein
MTASSLACVGCRDLFGAALPLFDNDYLTAAVVPAIGTDVMNHVRLAASIAGHQDRHVLDKVVPPPVALAVAADPLFWQRSHR